MLIAYSCKNAHLKNSLSFHIFEMAEEESHRSGKTDSRRWSNLLRKNAQSNRDTEHITELLEIVAGALKFMKGSV